MNHHAQAPYPTPFRFLRIDDAERVAQISTWLDEETGADYKGQPLAQDIARFTKVSEELGEAMDAFLGFTAQNPRKGKYSSRDEFLQEMADVALTAIYAIQHFTHDYTVTSDILSIRLSLHHDRMVKYYASQRNHP